MEPRAIAKRSSQYFFVRVFATALHLAGNFIIAKLFSVAGYGAYGFLFLILTYGASLHIGLENAFGKQYPVEIGKGNRERANNLRDSGFTFSMAMTFAITVAIIIFAFIYPHPEFEKRWSYIVIALTLPMQMLVEYYRTFFRVSKRFELVNTMELIYGVLEFVLRIAPVYYFVYRFPRVEYALIGLFIGLFLSFGLTLLYAYFIAPEKIGFRWKMPETKYMFRLGIPIFTCFFMDSLFKNGDKFIAKAFFEDTGMGYYLLGSQISGLLYFVPFAIGWVIFPLMLQKYGETADGTKVSYFVFPPTSTIIQIILPFGAMMYLALDFIIPALLSKYAPTILAAKILIPGMFFWCVVNMFTYFLIAMDDRKRMLIYQVSSLCLNLFLNWLLGVHFSMYIYGISLGTTIAYFLYSIIIMHYTISKYFGTNRQYAWYYLRIVFVYLLVFVPVVAFDSTSIARYWGDFFKAISVLSFLSQKIQGFGFIHYETLMNGLGIFMLEMLCTLIFSGLVSLAIRKWNLLFFDVKFKKAWLKS